MLVYNSLPNPPLAGQSSLTIGNFDGVHRGHQALVQAMRDAAHSQGLLAGLLTFSPHPVTVLRPGATHLYLTSMEERLVILQELGLDFVVVYPFSQEAARTPARQFVRDLEQSLHLRELWVGPDFALGRNREGDVAALRLMGQEMGFSVRVIEPQTLGNGEVRSGRIREHLLQGDVAEAARHLGRPYRVAGVVVPGAHRGRSIGFPTANLEVPSQRLLPGNGVYATWALLDGSNQAMAGTETEQQAPPQQDELAELRPEVAQRLEVAEQLEATILSKPDPTLILPSVTNIGVRPSFDNGERTVETHLLDFDGDLYQRLVNLEFVERLRPEMRFADVDALRSQISQDVERARAILARSARRWPEVAQRRG